MPDQKRCQWPSDDQLMIKYHDEEWGVPLHNDRKLFEFFVLSYIFLPRCRRGI